MKTARMSWGCRMGVTVMGVALALCLFLLIGAVAATMKKNSSAPEFQIGDRSFRVPMKYIQVGEPTASGPVTGTNLRALLPNFEGYESSTREEFERPNSKREINVMVAIHNADAFGRSFPVMTRAVVYDRLMLDYATGKPRKVVKQDGPFGLTRQHLDPPRREEFYVGRLPDGTTFWTSCSSDSYVNPQCDTYIEYSPQVMLKYHFPKARLYEWPKLDQRVINFVRQFEIGKRD